MKCVFCRLIKQNKVFLSPSKNVAFTFDEFPATKGHMLIFPTSHVESVLQLTESQIIEMIKVAKMLIKILSTTLGTESFHLLLNEKVWKIEKSPLHVKHIHLHIIPRYNTGERKKLIRRGFLLKRPKKVENIAEKNKKLKASMHKITYFLEKLKEHND
jgi:diadenosine tetraphosphate (Ap4A) HIT family hydrolase